MLSKEDVIEALNQAIAREHASAIRYFNQALALSVAKRDPAGARLRDIAADEREHARALRHQVYYLGGEPSLEIDEEGLRGARRLEEMLAINIAEEQRAIAMYRELLSQVEEADMGWLRETLEDIVRDEEHHLSELATLAA